MDLPPEIDYTRFRERLQAELSELLHVPRAQISVLEVLFQKGVVCIYFDGADDEDFCARIECADRSGFPLLARVRSVKPHTAGGHRDKESCDLGLGSCLFNVFISIYFYSNFLKHIILFKKISFNSFKNRGNSSEFILIRTKARQNLMSKKVNRTKQMKKVEATVQMFFTFFLFLLLLLIYLLIFT